MLVQASVRQEWNNEWSVANAEWSTAVRLETNDIWLSSYVNMTTASWVTTYMRDGAEIGRGVWSFEDTL